MDLIMEGCVKGDPCCLLRRWCTVRHAGDVKRVRQGILDRISREISSTVHSQYGNLTLSIRFAALGFRDVGDSNQFEVCGFVPRAPASTRAAVLRQNDLDAARVTAHVRAQLSLDVLRPPCVHCLWVLAS
jgi:hypothetical protein